MAQINCRHFTGYKPCNKNSACDESCHFRDVPRYSLLIVHLGALGAVLRSTSLLRALKRKYPRSLITWVTDAPAHHLLKNHPAIDRVLTTSESDLLSLGALEFECAFVVDKSLKAVGVLHKTRVDKVYGFTSHPLTGAIVPATEAATELWHLGLNNHLKFFVNSKPETQLMIEALELGPYRRDEYWLPLSTEEMSQLEIRRKSWLGQENKSLLLGINTGCSSIIPYKKLTVQFHREIIEQVMLRIPSAQVVLLGGPEDTDRNQAISQGLPVVVSETQAGLRDGLVSVAAMDVVLTGDSLGMHMAISQKKQVVAWFGPTCAHEIELYDRGYKILSQSACSPCWKRSCEKNIMCYDQVSLEEIVHALKSCSANGLSGGSPSLNSTSEEMSGPLAPS